MLFILILEKEFRLFYSKSLFLENRIYLFDKEYEIDDTSKKNNGFICFFDWLRLNKEKIIGIRMCYFEDLIYNSILENRSYINSTNKGLCKEIFFSNDKSYITELSGDQDFTNNYVYKSKTDDYLLTFGLDHLAEVEKVCVSEYCNILT